MSDRMQMGRTGPVRPEHAIDLHTAFGASDPLELGAKRQVLAYPHFRIKR